MSYHLPQPSEALSNKILGSVSYKNRFPAGRLTPPVGIIYGDVRSLPELHKFLAPDIRSLPGINLKGLPGWIEEIIGDRELADMVHTILNTSVSYVEDCMKIHDLLGFRIDQARNILKESMR